MHLQPSTAIDVLNSQNPSFAVIKKSFEGEDGIIAIRAILTLIINEVLDFFNVGKSMSDKQVGVTVNLILEDYAVLKPDDFKLCFKRAMKGQYGKVYDRIDGELIFEWIEEYLGEKAFEIERFRQSENNKLKKESDFLMPEETIDIDHEDVNTPVPMPDYIKDKFLKPKAPEVKEFEIPKPRVLTEEQKFYNGLIRVWEEAFRVRGIQLDGSTMKFVNFYGKKMTLEEYMNHKSSQIERIKGMLK